MKRLLVVIILASTPVFAQPKPSPELEAVGAKLMQEINAGIQCNANAIVGRQELEKLQAELKALKAKYEPEVKSDAEQQPEASKDDGSSRARPKIR